MENNQEKYYAIVLDGNIDSQCEEYWFSIDRLLHPEMNENNYEFIHSLSKGLGDVLSMQVGESVIFQPSMNDGKSVGILRRIQ